MKAKTSMIALACLSLLLLVANILLHVLPKNENSVQTQKKFVSSNQQRLSNMKLDRARFQLNKTSMEARKKRLPRVYCALPFTWRDHEPERGKQLSQMKFILKHWASRCDGVGFFIISKDPDVITEVWLCLLACRPACCLPLPFPFCPVKFPCLGDRNQLWWQFVPGNQT